VATSVSWPSPTRCYDGDGDKAQRVDHDAAGIHPGRGGVLFIEQRLEAELAPLGSRHAAMPIPGQHAGRTQPIALPLHRREIYVGEHLVYYRVIVAAVVSAAARDQIGKLVLADEIAAAHLDPFKSDSRATCPSRSRSHNCRCLPEPAHRFLHRLVGGDGLRAYCTLSIL